MSTESEIALMTKHQDEIKFANLDSPLELSSLQDGDWLYETGSKLEKGPPNRNGIGLGVHYLASLLERCYYPSSNDDIEDITTWIEVDIEDFTGKTCRTGVVRR